MHFTLAAAPVRASATHYPTAPGAAPRSHERWRAPSLHVLRFAVPGASQGTVRRHYAAWRQQRGLRVRCDNPDCAFHEGDLIWRGQPLPVILDHINGVRRDNRPENLRYLCPNCDALLETRGGRNKGRVQNLTERGYLIVSRDGRPWSATRIPDPASLTLKENTAPVIKRK
jgi:hypothetical protein